MPLDYQKIMALPPIETVQELTFRDTILYALGVGVGASDPTDPAELQYVYEDGLKALPTLAVVMAFPGFWLQRPEYGVTWQKVLHGEQSIEIHRSPLPVEGLFRGVTQIDEIYDKGADKGAVVLSSRRLYTESGEHVATARQASFLRGDGGFGGKSEGAPKPHPLPDRAPDLTTRATTQVSQALLYRLSGDYNPIHADPKVAKQGGFERPILHGLASYGVVGRALTKAVCGDVPERVRRMDVRFSSPVYPGETFEIDIWREGPGQAAFRVRVVERDVVVLQNGYLEYGD
jgi:acyl dehydratase